MNRMSSLACLIAALSFFFVFSSHAKTTKLLLGGSGWNKIVIIDKDTKKIEWEHPLEAGQECNSVAFTKEGNILYSYSKGAKLITKDHKELWSIPAPNGAEMQTAAILKNGNYLLAWCGHPATILEVDKKGKVLSKTEYETGIETPHAQFRQVRKNSRGNYMMPLFATSDVREISPAGKLLKSVKVGGTPFTTAALPNGNYLVACGDGHSYLELNFDTENVVRKVNANDVEGASFFFVAGILPTAAGGEYICNWQGHGGDAASDKLPQLIEVDKNGKMIWSLNDNATFGMISAICEAK